ncbi:hypothetical protein WKW77_29270 [Variovorax ureilyticus]|uniref:Uncharacterized protein n=1 Tax=Variovorax ureilyticus TaxID=1836198 RepID=A0ABU8VNH1_9BURK
MLEEVDRARQLVKQLDAGGAKEQQRRIQSEEAAAQTLEAGRRMLRETQQAAQQVERELRDRLADQASLLAQAQSQASTLQQRLDDVERHLSEEKTVHEATRGLLAGALAVPSAGKPPPKTAARRGKASSPQRE